MVVVARGDVIHDTSLYRCRLSVDSTSGGVGQPPLIGSVNALIDLLSFCGVEVNHMFFSGVSERRLRVCIIIFRPHLYGPGLYSPRGPARL